MSDKHASVSFPPEVLKVIEQLAKGGNKGSVDANALKKLESMKLEVKDAAHPQGLICRFDLSCWVV